MSRKSVIALIVVGFLISIQAIQPPRDSEAIRLEKDFLEIHKPEATVSNIIKTACYDCHSDSPVYPWYSYITPVNWWLQHHIDEGREHLNFSKWGEYSVKKQKHKLEECVEMVEDGQMPLESYSFIHKDARLSHKERNALEAFFKNLNAALINE